MVTALFFSYEPLKKLIIQLETSFCVFFTIIREYRTKIMMYLKKYRFLLELLDNFCKFAAVYIFLTINKLFIPTRKHFISGWEGLRINLNYINYLKSLAMNKKYLVVTMLLLASAIVVAGCRELPLWWVVPKREVWLIERSMRSHLP